MTITTSEGQTAKDIALRYYGSESGIFLLIADNASVIITPSSVFPAGTKINIKSTPIKPEVVDYYKTNSINPSSVTAQEIAIFDDFGGDFINDFTN